MGFTIGGLTNKNPFTKDIGSMTFKAEKEK